MKEIVDTLRYFGLVWFVIMFVFLGLFATTCNTNHKLTTEKQGLTRSLDEIVSQNTNQRNYIGAQLKYIDDQTLVINDARIKINYLMHCLDSLKNIKHEKSINIYIDHVDKLNQK